MTPGCETMDDEYACLAYGGMAPPLRRALERLEATEHDPEELQPPPRFPQAPLREHEVRIVQAPDPGWKGGFDLVFGDEDTSEGS